ncbi:MAG: cache domain-containing protein, partial [Coleofasciculaceae cyanobacterium]
MTLLRSITNQAQQLTSKVPLRALLIVPFVVQISAIVGLTGWLSLRNGQLAVNEVTIELRKEVVARLQQRLRDYLRVPHLLNQINADAIESGQYQPETNNLTRHYWRQRFLFESGRVSSIYFGTNQGEFTGLAYLDNGTWQFSRAGQSTGGKYHRYDHDDKGNPTNLITEGADYDPRRRPWYKQIEKTTLPAWSPIYSDFNNPRLTITLAQPIYDKTRVLRGVVGVDLVLVEIGEFLRQLKIGKSGKVFIIEHSGKLVASSTTQKPFMIKNGAIEQIKATDVEDPLIRATAKYLNQNQDLKQIKNSRPLEFFVKGQRQLVQVVPFSDSNNLNWLIVVVVPEAEFMGQINANTRTTILLCLVALAIATGIGILTSRWITRPILQLSKTAVALSQGEWNQTIPNAHATEVRVLAQSFRQMAEQLQQSFAALQAAKVDLEVRVEQRTGLLREANTQLRDEILERRRSEQTLRSIVQGTASVTGNDFFRSLVASLATALQVRYALISECADASA